MRRQTNEDVVCSMQQTLFHALMGLTKVKLYWLCKANLLPASGNKADLAARLIAHFTTVTLRLDQGPGGQWLAVGCVFEYHPQPKEDDEDGA